MAGINDAEYVELFLAEARENLETLNTAVVGIEANPSDRETIDSIFRVAHSVKGMAATMGYDEIAALTHAMEDVFSLLRERTSGLDRDAIDVLFDCLDMLSTMVSEVEASGKSTTDPDALIFSLKGLVRGRDRRDVVGPMTEAAAADQAAEEASTKKPAAKKSAAKKSSADAPTKSDPTKSDPTNAEPTAEAPSTEARATEAPATEAPATEAPATEAPATEAPTTEAPATTEPTAKQPTEEQPSPEAPAPAVPKPAPDLVGAAVKEAQTRATVRVEASRLDTLLHMIGELVVRRSSVEQLAAETGHAQLLTAVNELTRASQAVQDMVMRVRMVPIDTAFARLPRLVRDLSNQLGKRVDLQIEGRDTELDRTAVDALVEPLMHLVRNAIDHGIEKPEMRGAEGKPELGKLLISARHEGGEVVIAISDDGAGVDHRAVMARAVERGLVPAENADRFDPEQAIEFIFMPGFSTMQSVSDVSGRGVGMDAVRAAVRGFGGDVRVRSTPGKGTTMELRMPLTLAILPALVVRAAGDPYALQLDRVDRTFKLEEVTIKSAAGMPVAVFDEGSMPVVRLADMFNRKSDEPRFMVTVRSADRQLALLVDDMVGRRELVTRPVPERVRRDSPVSGGAVLASGEIAFIVDCEELIRRVLIEPIQTATG